MKYYSCFSNFLISNYIEFSFLAPQIHFSIDFNVHFDIIYWTRFWQVVLTSTDPSELCINGMSFSRRSSKWANAALVVTVSSKDFSALDLNGPLAGVEFQVLLKCPY